MHNTLVRKRNSTRMDELLQQFKVTQFENELLNAKIGLLMGEIAVRVSETKNLLKI
jgi:hypothetical protein